MRLLIPVLLFPILLAGCDNDSAIRISTRSDGQSTADGVLRVVQALQCPETQGVLTRKGAPAADGLSCTYSGPRGSEVVLQLVALDGATPETLLQGFETRLQADLPQAMARINAMPAPPTTPETPETPDAGAQEDVDVTMPGVDVRTRGDNAVVRLPGLSIEAEGENARVRIGGLNISADNDSQQVAIETDDDRLQIRSQDEAAEIRTRADGGGVRASYVLVDESASATGWRLVGYEARGPSVGPLVVATVRSRNRQEDDLFDAAKALVTANVGE